MEELHDGAGQHCFISQSLWQHFRALRVGSKASEQDVLTVIDDDLTALFSIIFLHLGKGLDTGSLNILNWNQ